MTAAALASASAILSCHSKAASEPATAPAEAAHAVKASDSMSSCTVFTDKALDEAAEAWADSIMAGMTLRQKVAQLFVPRIDLISKTKDAQKLRQLIAKDQMGGFLLGKGSMDRYMDMIKSGQASAKVPLLITLDGEWGLSMRISDTPRFPYNVALGATRDADLAYAYGLETGRQCKLMGIQVDFAPVLDVNSNPDNPVIGYRSFGEDPELVGRLGAAYCRGMMDSGVMPVGKHFPGHGDTSTDSHKTLPLVDHSIKTLKDVDMLPFRMAMEAGMPAVMVGHLKVPALDKSGRPASMSEIITRSWLRDSLGFTGLVFTDALAMKGAALQSENNCVSAFLAGADVLLSSKDPSADLDAMMAAVKSGKIDVELINGSCFNILKYKYKLGLSKKPGAYPADMRKKLFTPHCDSLITAISQKAITVIGNRDKVLPLKKSDKKSVVVVNIGAPAKNEFSEACSRLIGASMQSVETAAVPASVTKAVNEADIVIIAVYRDNANAKKAFATLSGMKKCIGVFFTEPFKILKFDNLSALQTTVLAYDDIPQLRKAAADAIAGAIGVSGKLPVNLPGFAKAGDGVTYKKIR